jgi:hypothetical protein
MANSELARELGALYQALAQRRTHTVRLCAGAATFAVAPHLPLLAHADTSVDRYPPLHSQLTLLLRAPYAVVAERLGPAAAPGFLLFLAVMDSTMPPPTYAHPPCAILPRALI